MEYIRLKNFRCFDDTGTISLSPLMLLVGANSSGKSSFLKQFPLIKQSVRYRRNGVYLWNRSGGIDLDNFSNTLRDGAEEMMIEYGIENLNLMHQRPVTLKRKYKSIPHVKVSIEMRKVNDRFEYLNRLTICFYDQVIEIEFNENSLVENLKINGIKMNGSDEIIVGASTNSLLPRLIYIKEKHVDEDISHICRKLVSDLKQSISENQNTSGSHTSIHYISAFAFDRIEAQKNIRTWLSRLYEEPKEDYGLNELYIWYKLNRILDSLNYYFLDLANNITYVQPVRANAERYYRIDNIATDEINSDGTNLAMFLYNLPKNEFVAFQRWTKKLFKFNVKLKPSEGHVQLQIEIKDSHVVRNMIDMGFGYSQILPILAIIWKALNDFATPELVHKQTESNDPARIIVIEQPELHLHPRFISMFASMLAKIIIDTKKLDKRMSIIIETHSEAMINAIGEAIANTKSFGEEDVKILLFNAPQEFSETEISTNYIQEAFFDEGGFLRNWPYGFFDI